MHLFKVYRNTEHQLFCCKRKKKRRYLLLSSPPCYEKISCVLTLFHVFWAVFVNANGKFSDTFCHVHIEDPLHPGSVRLTTRNELNQNSTKKILNFDHHTLMLTTFYTSGMDFLVVETKSGMWKMIWWQKFRLLYNFSY